VAATNAPLSSLSALSALSEDTEVPKQQSRNQIGRLCCFGLSPALSLSKGWLTGSTRFACSRQTCIGNPYLPKNPTKPRHFSLPSGPARRSLGEGGANSADSEDSGAFCLPKVKSL